MLGKLLISVIVAWVLTSFGFAIYVETAHPIGEHSPTVAVAIFFLLLLATMGLLSRKPTQA